MNQQQHRLMQVLQKISVFKGLELEHIQRLLRVGTSQTYGIGEQVYSIGEPSDEMLVLLQGKMVVTSAGGEELGDLGPGMLTGEMGVFTNQPRSANISSVDRSVAVGYRAKCIIVRFGLKPNHLCSHFRQYRRDYERASLGD